MDEGHVLDDHRVGLHHRLARADGHIVNATVRDDRRAGSLGSKTRKSLCVTPFGESSDGKDLCGGDHPLATSAMNSYLEHGRLAPSSRVVTYRKTFEQERGNQVISRDAGHKTTVPHVKPQ